MACLNRLAAKRFVLLLILFALTGCITPSPSHRIAHWQTHTFEGESVCRNADHIHRTDVFVVEFRRSGKLADGTIWMTLELQELVPDRYHSPHSSAGEKYLRSCGMTLVVPLRIDDAPGSTAEVWLINERFPSSKHQAPSIELLRKQLAASDYEQMIGSVDLLYDSPRNIALDIDAHASTAFFELKLDGSITTQRHFGRIKTTYNMKGIGTNHYVPWVTRNWP